MTAADRVKVITDRLRNAPGRIAATDEATHELLERVLQVLHLAETSEVALREHRDVFADVEAALASIADLDRIVGTSADRSIEQFKASIAALLRALDAPRRDEAFAETIAAIESRDDLAAGLSILIATWNHATRLGTAIDCACEATDPANVIVLDDASSDETTDLLASRDEPIRTIRAAGGLGLTRARNALLRAAHTRHVLFLDADNEIEPTEVVRLVELAEAWGAAAVNGVLLQVDGDGTATDVVGTRPMNGTFFELRHNEVDTVAVLDLAAVRGVGGYTLDASLESSEDWDMWHRLAGSGGLLVHAPVVTGRKLRVPQGHNSQPQDHDHQFSLIDRTYRFDGRLNDETVASAVIHPDVGPLWASAAAVRMRPDLGPALPEVHHDVRLPEAPPVRPRRPSVLVVGSAGVRNLGDDVTTVECVRRVVEAVDDGVEIEVVTDGPRPPIGLAPAVWLGTLAEYAPRALDHHLAVVFSGGGTITDNFAQQTDHRRLIAVMAERAGVPVLATGQGLGPIGSVRPAAEQVIGRAAAVSCRDHASGHMASDLAATTADVVGDDAAAPEPPRSSALPSVLRGLPERGWLTFNARLARYTDVDEDELAAWAAVVDEAAAELHLPVVAVGLNRQPPTELETAMRLANGRRQAAWMTVGCTDDPDGARAVFGLAAGGVVRSYHAAWFAIEGGAPVVFPTRGTYYRAKALGLAGLAGLGEDFTESTIPADAGELRQRWKQVESAIQCGPLADMDQRASRWIRDHLGAAGVPLRSSPRGVR